MFPFHGVDYMEIDGLFNDQEKLVRQTVREFVDKEVLPGIEEWNREGKFPRHLVPLMAELGLFGANLEGYGCAGMSNVEYGLIMQELERGDSGLRSFVSVQGALVMYPIREYGSEEQKRALAACPPAGLGHRLLRPDRTRLRLQPRRHAYPRREGGRPLHTERREGLDHLRHHCGRRPGLGAHGRRHSRLPGGERNAGLHLQGHQGEMVAARFGDLEPLAPGRSPAGARACFPRRRG